ncbi:MAG: hypothetical protein RL417_2260 [Pseudomonadota bacterium]|jgi:hypothetical protein
MRCIALFLGVCLGSAVAHAVEDPTVYRVQCKAHSAAVTDLENAMARGLRFFAEKQGVTVASQSVTVRLIPLRSNGAEFEIRKSDLAGQWAVGPDGVLIFKSAVTSRCELAFQVLVRGKVGESLVGGRIVEPVKISGGYVRSLNSLQRKRLERLGRRRA